MGYVYMKFSGRMFMSECRLRLQNESRNAIEDFGQMVPWSEIACCAYKVTNRGRENKFRKEENTRG